MPPLPSSPPPLPLLPPLLPLPLPVCPGPKLNLKLTQTHSLTQMYLHTYINTCIHTIHRHIQTLEGHERHHTHLYTCVYAQTHPYSGGTLVHIAHIWALVHISTQCTYMYIRTHTCTHTYTHVYTCTHTCTRVHIRTHTCARVHIFKYVDIHTRIQTQQGPQRRQRRCCQSQRVCRPTWPPLAG